ncbi:hypothetical protein RUM44_000437 [Polyplax serrata]|uniref:Uncharacterized protein n=1 Tax=Polyplax serrata TaxID=468196 RepID=A0ABR1B6M2_POLSC
MDVSDVPEYVMNTLCRVCAEKSCKLISIFEDDLLPTKIGKCLPIQVKKEDDLPLNVCESCFRKLDEAYLLYETAQKSNDRLKTLWNILIKETSERYPDVGTVPDTSQFTDALKGLVRDVPDGNEGKIILNDTNIIDARECESGMDRKDIESAEVVSKNTVPLESAVNSKKPKQSNKTYQCRFCTHQLTTLSSLSIHESTHSQVKPFLCDTCGKSFKHANNLRCHARTHLNVKKKHICRICSKGFLSNFFLQEHMNSHTGSTPYKCGQCGKEFREKVHLRQHKWTHSNEKFICPICGNSFSRKGNMNEHIKKFHQSNSITKETLINELKFPETFTCSICNINFAKEPLLRNHMKIHPEEKRFSCAICGKKFRHSGSLTYHRRAAHTGEKPFQCNYCDQRFSLRSVQQIHERKVHTFEKPYKCSFCFRMFNNSSSLTNHMYVHSQKKLFECEECGKHFSRNSNLDIHKKLHTGERKFACDDCDKTYIQRYDLLKHKKIHDPKSKPFFCKYCGNCFSQKKDAAKHATCQFDFIRKNNSDTCSAEKILDSVSDTFHNDPEEFFHSDNELILTSVELH